MLQNITNNWTWSRGLRMVLGLFMAYQAYVSHDKLLGAFAAFFIFQAVTGTGCCSTAGCTTTPNKNSNDTNKIEDVSYEEIK
jgi:hypothetical protein